MEEIYCYSYVEDLPSKEVAKKLVTERNSGLSNKLRFLPGFPAITSGYGLLQKKCTAFTEMAKGGLRVFSITDLDTRPCAGGLIRDWFHIPAKQSIALPKGLVFRVAIREVESWIMADREAWAKYIEIPEANFSSLPDSLPDPKRHLLSVIRKKGPKKYHKEMLPRGTANVGPRYNEILSRFVRQEWTPARAASRSPSLARAIMALKNI